MTPFNITIEITEATQCHQAVSQLLRVYPKLRLTITVQDETIPTPSGPSQTCNAADRCGHCRECRAIVRAIDAIRSYHTSGYLSAVGANEAGKAANPSYTWKPGEHTEGAADARAEDERLAAEAAAAERDWRNDNSDAGYDDTNANGR